MNDENPVPFLLPLPTCMLVPPPGCAELACDTGTRLRCILRCTECRLFRRPCGFVVVVVVGGGEQADTGRERTGGDKGGRGGESWRVAKQL